MTSFPDFIDLPNQERVPLDVSPLTLAVCEVRFGAILSVADSSYVAPFQREIIEHFPVAAPADQLEISLTLGQGQGRVQGRPASRRWVFTDASGAWKTVLAEDSIVLETRKYDSFDDFLARLTIVLTALEKSIRPTVVTRLGLRYINEIREPDVNWKEIINPLVVGPAGESGFSGKAEALEFLCHFNFRYPGRKGCNLVCGLLPQGTVVANPLPTTRLDQPFFLLDIDAFEEYEMGGSPGVDTASICTQVARFHETIYSVFRWSVSDSYIDDHKVGAK